MQLQKSLNRAIIHIDRRCLKEQQGHDPKPGTYKPCPDETPLNPSRRSGWPQLNRLVFRCLPAMILYPQGNYLYERILSLTYKWRSCTSILLCFVQRLVWLSHCWTISSSVDLADFPAKPSSAGWHDFDADTSHSASSGWLGSALTPGSAHSPAFSRRFSLRTWTKISNKHKGFFLLKIKIFPLNLYR